MSKIQQVNREVKARILAEDAATMKAVGRNYDAFYKSVAQSAKALAAQVKKLKAEGKDVQGRLFQLRQYNDMLRQFEKDRDLCCRSTANIVKKAQERAIAQGAEDAQALAFADMEDRQGDFAYIWNAPDNKAYENMVGYTEKGSPLVDVLKKHSRLFGRGKIIEALRVGVLHGDAPERIARRMRQIGWDDAKHAELVARAETMRCYRQSSLDSYEANSDVVEGVIWVCAHQARTCATCWAMDGRLFKLGEDVPNDHPNGRCTYLPKTKDVPGLDTGVEPWEPDKAFDQLTDEEQRRILGLKKYDKYKNQGIPLRSFAQIKQNDIWGSQVTGADPVAPQPATGTNPGQKSVKAVVPSKMKEWLRTENKWDDAKLKDLEERLNRLPEAYRFLWNKHVNGALARLPKDKRGAYYKNNMIYLKEDDIATTIIHEAFHQVDDQAGKVGSPWDPLSHTDEFQNAIHADVDKLTAGKSYLGFKSDYCTALGIISEAGLRNRTTGCDGIQDIIDGATEGKYRLAFGHSWPECDTYPEDWDSGGKKVPYWDRYKDKRDLQSKTFANVPAVLSRPDSDKGKQYLLKNFPETVRLINDMIEKRAEDEGWTKNTKN